MSYYFWEVSKGFKRAVKCHNFVGWNGLNWNISKTQRGIAQMLLMLLLVLSALLSSFAAPQLDGRQTPPLLVALFGRHPPAYWSLLSAPVGGAVEIQIIATLFVNLFQTRASGTIRSSLSIAACNSGSWNMRAFWTEKPITSNHHVCQSGRQSSGDCEITEPFWNVGHEMDVLLDSTLLCIFESEL